jgi:hypothetical protein
VERALAEQLMHTFLAMSEPLNSATSLTAQMENKEEQESLRRAIGNVMQMIYIDLMRPVIRQYPDLDPDRPR